MISWLSVVGLVWSVLTVYLLYFDRGREWTRNPWLLLITGPLMLVSVFYVASEVDAIRLLAGGLAPLDVHFGYRASDITALAEALGASGRRAYASFQLGADTLAPPAFACFILNVSRVSVPFRRIRRLLTALISVYFFSVLLANALMPVIMLNYPSQHGLLGPLYDIVPVLDLLKYSVHAFAWMIVLGSWLVALYRRLFAEPERTSSG